MCENRQQNDHDINVSSTPLLFGCLRYTLNWVLPLSWTTACRLVVRRALVCKFPLQVPVPSQITKQPVCKLGNERAKQSINSLTHVCTMDQFADWQVKMFTVRRLASLNDQFAETGTCSCASFATSCHPCLHWIDQACRVGVRLP